MCRKYRQNCGCLKKTFKPNHPVSEYVAKYTKYHGVVFDADKQATLTYAQLCCSDILVTCIGSKGNDAANNPVTYQLFIPDIGIPFTRFARQYFQLYQIPIKFLFCRINRHMVGNAVLEIYINGALAFTTKNTFYYTTPPLVSDESFYISRHLYIYYAETDDNEFKSSPYYCEPIIPQGILNGCHLC